MFCLTLFNVNRTFFLMRPVISNFLKNKFRIPFNLMVRSTKISLEKSKWEFTYSKSLVLLLAQIELIIMFYFNPV